MMYKGILVSRSSDLGKAISDEKEPRVIQHIYEITGLAFEKLYGESAGWFYQTAKRFKEK